MASTLSPSEEAQLSQTIEMFEVITQSQPEDYSSLEILKEAYAKLGKETEAIRTSKRIAESYVQMGQLSSAILEYETILQRYPDDPDVQSALREIETKAGNFPAESGFQYLGPSTKSSNTARSAKAGALAGGPLEVDDGKDMMRKLFVDSRTITPGDFDLCWPAADLGSRVTAVTEPFVQVLADKGILALDRSLKMVADRSRAGFLPLHLYDADMDLARTFPPDICRRWCILPFDRMSKSIFVATANPFNRQAAKDLAQATPLRLLWYLVLPGELLKMIRRAFR